VAKDKSPKERPPYCFALRVPCAPHRLWGCADGAPAPAPHARRPCGARLSGAKLLAETGSRARHSTLSFPGAAADSRTGRSAYRVASAPLRAFSTNDSGALRNRRDLKTPNSRHGVLTSLRCSRRFGRKAESHSRRLPEGRGTWMCRVKSRSDLIVGALFFRLFLLGTWIQRVAATQAANRSAGVSNPKVFLGRSLSCRATASKCRCK
jgi:hypothetical protein